MSTSIMNNLSGSARRSLAGAAGAIALTALACITGSASAAVPGIGGTSFALQANQGYNSQPDGVQLYSWGYGCASTYTPTFAPASFAAAGVPQFCAGASSSLALSSSNMQMPG